MRITMGLLLLVLTMLVISTGLASTTNQGAASVPNRLITRQAAGPVRLGMTVAEARRALPGFTLSRTSDGEGLALIAVERAGKMIMTVYAGEVNPKTRLNERARIEYIEVWDQSYHTAAGVHPKMQLREVVQKYGELKEIVVSEIEAREYATFAQQPVGIQLRLMADDGMAGVYGEEERSTTRYSPSAHVFSISINGM